MLALDTLTAVNVQRFQAFATSLVMTHRARRVRGWPDEFENRPSSNRDAEVSDEDEST
jgi:hypothetical protein